MMNCTLQEITERIKQAKRVLIVTHMRPDGDAFGSALALSRALDYLKIDNEVCVETDVPSNLAFIEGVDRVQKTPTALYDLLVTVDCSDEQRLGALQEEFLIAKRKKIDTINIDHHVSNRGFAKYNFVRCCSANCMNVALLIEDMGAPLDKKTAEYLLIGLLTDSGNFSHDDVTEEALSLGAKLVKTGANICYYNYMLFKKQPKARAALFAKTMSAIRYYHEDRFAVIVVSKENMEACGADNGMTEGFVDFPLNVDTVEVAASVMEVKKGQYKISLRSKNYADVNKIAGVYGGGGHVRAAGCMLFGEVEEVLDKLSYTVSQYLE
ncbi:MAG: bifunctional oligoribonuclease/PAP phosphatase NrnA [Clostridia bacterium]|nr:bifunctional oligoribonuclease/PAP phosphatase NrnA [Clostridia bacterium]